MKRIILEEKTIPSLMRVRQDARLTTSQLAAQAGLALRDVYLAEIGVPVEETIAWRITRALNELTGCSYSRETILIHVKTKESEAPRYVLY